MIGFNYHYNLKFLLKKYLGRWLPHFNNDKIIYRNLKNTIPEYFKNILSENFDKKALILSMGPLGWSEECITAKALEVKGYEVIILSSYSPYVKKIWNLFGIDNLIFWDDYFSNVNLKKYTEKAKALINNVENDKDVQYLTYQNVNVGRYALSTMLRKYRKGTYSLNKDKELIIYEIAASLIAVDVAYQILTKFSPNLVVVIDRAYTPIGPFFDVALEFKIPVLNIVGSHKSDCFILKKYISPKFKTCCPRSIYRETWEMINNNLSWNKSYWEILYNEKENIYKSSELGTWFDSQINKKMYMKDEILKKLNLTKNKKIAAVFPHICWDAPFSWDTMIFKDYYEWFVEVLKIAKKNNNLYWIIKIHPDSVREGNSVELEAFYKVFGNDIPPHIRLLPPETDIKTWSLYNVIDYCLTVKGTAGLECAILGIPVITAGTSFYSGYGFTYDFKDKKDYFSCLEELDKISPLNTYQIELARKFGYIVFILRPFCQDIVCFNVVLNSKKQKIRLPEKFLETKEEFINSNFCKELDLFLNSTYKDYINFKKLNINKTKEY